MNKKTRITRIASKHAGYEGVSTARLDDPRAEKFDVIYDALAEYRDEVMHSLKRRIMSEEHLRGKRECIIWHIDRVFDI